MIAVVSVLLVLTISMIVIRVATVALVHTGMRHRAARFQACSAFTGAGFTTSEAESVVNDPWRRRLVAWLMIAGNVGIVSAMSSWLSHSSTCGRARPHGPHSASWSPA